MDQIDGTNVQLGSDLPKTKTIEDALGYSRFANEIAKAIISTPSPKGLVMAIHGPWGAGKTTLLNFIKEQLELVPEAGRVVVIDFNPWWFNDRDHLVAQFLSRFNTALRLGPSSLVQVGHLMAKYNKSLATVASTSAGIPWVSPVIAWCLGLFGMKKKDVPQLKQEISVALGAQQRRVLFIIDDIDRLTPDEIRELFKGIKALADFPNVIYLLSFDRRVVHLALEKTLGVDGASYLEKIVQVPFSLPAVDKDRLRRLFCNNMDMLLSLQKSNKFDSEHWQNIFFGINQFLLKPRDVVRLTNALMVAYPPVAGEVDFADFVSMEALRIFDTSVYELIRDNRDFFAGHADQNRDPEKPVRLFHDAWLAEVHASRRDLMKRFVSDLFPRAACAWGGAGHGSEWNRTWRAELRVCSPDLYDTFFQFGVPDDSLSRIELDMFVRVAVDPRAAETLLTAANSIIRPDGSSKAGEYLARLADLQDEISIEAAAGTLAALSNIGDGLLREEDGGRGFFRLPLDWKLVAVVDHLLQRIAVDDRWRELRQFVTNGHALGLSVFVVNRMQTHLNKIEEHSDRALAGFDAVEVEDLKGVVKDRLRRLPGQDFLNFRDLKRVLYAWKHLGDDQQVKDKIAPLFTRAELIPILLEKFKDVGQSNVIGKDAVIENIHLDPRQLEDFADLDQLEPLLQDLLLGATMSPPQRDAANSFLRNMARLRAGEPVIPEFQTNALNSSP